MAGGLQFPYSEGDHGRRAPSAPATAIGGPMADLASATHTDWHRSRACRRGTNELEKA